MKDIVQQTRQAFKTGASAGRKCRATMITALAATMIILTGCCDLRKERQVEKDEKGQDTAVVKPQKTRNVIPSEPFQIPDEPPEEFEENKIYYATNQMPEFPGGHKGLMEWFSDNIRYPEEAKDKGETGRVIVQFVVEKDGSLSNIEVAKSVHPILDEEAVRIVKSMPKWIPGKYYGHIARVKYTVPVTFKIPQSEE